MVVDEMEVLLKQDGIFRTDKYCILSDWCKSCHNGKVGCCVYMINFIAADFARPFESIEDVFRLLDTGIFFIDYYNASYYRVVLKMFDLSERYYYSDIECDDDDDDDDWDGGVSTVCILWTEHGCRLEAGKRPSVCRYHMCCDISKCKTQNKEMREYDKIVIFTKEEEELLEQAFMEVGNVKKHLSYEEYLELDWNKIMKVL